MTTITLRNTKGTPLTNTELDANFSNLNTDKVETGAVTSNGITMNTARLLGRSTAATGAVEEIALGSGLTLSAGTLSTSGGGSLNTLTAATGAATIANGNNPIAWNWTQSGTGTQTGFTIGETTASTGTVNVQTLFRAATLASSTANPIQIDARGQTIINVSATGAVTVNAGNGGITGGAGSSINLNGGTGTGSVGGNVGMGAGGGASTAAGGNATFSAGAGGSSGRAGVLTINGGISNAAQSGNSGGIVLNGGAAGAVASIAGGPVVITAGAGSTTTTGGTGGAISLTAGAGGLAAAGGIAALSGGIAGTTGSGGNVNIISGQGGSTSGSSGGVNIGTGSVTNGSSGSIAITTQAGAGTSAAGEILIQAGSSRATPATGIRILCSPAGAVASVGGTPIVITAGTGSTTTTGGEGGAVTISAGTGGLAARGGNLLLNGGLGGITGAGGSVLITSGTGGNTSGTSGSVSLASGNGTAGASGTVTIKSGTSSTLASGTITIQSSAGGGTSTSGDITIEQGATNVTPTNGIRILGAAAGTIASVAGGPIVLTAGAGSTTTTGGVGGAVSIAAGAGGLAAVGGNLTLSAGVGGATGVGGAITITAGAGGLDANGGSLNLYSGASSTGVGIGGSVNIVAASSGGSIGINAGLGGAGLTGGTVTITGGRGGSGTTTGGALTLRGGPGNSGSSTGGPVIITTSTSLSYIERLRILANGAWSVGTGGADTGTSGQVLTSTGATTPPTWQTASSYPRVGDVIVGKATDTNTITMGSNYYSKADGTIPWYAGGAQKTRMYSNNVGLQTYWTYVAVNNTTTSPIMVMARDINNVGVNPSTIYSSPDGITWTSRALPSTNTWKNVAFALTSGGALFIVQAPNTDAYITSTDGITWTTSANTFPVNANWSFIRTANNTFYTIAAASNTLYSSTDGATWSSQTLSATKTFTGIAANTTSDSSTATAVLVMTSSTDAVATTYSGGTWAERTLPNSAGASLSVPVYYNKLFIVFGHYSNKYWTSPDGVTWIQRTLPYTPSGPFRPYVHSGILFAYNIAASGEAAPLTKPVMLSSVDGISWTANPNTAYNTGFGYLTWILDSYDIAAIKGNFVISNYNRGGAFGSEYNVMVPTDSTAIFDSTSLGYGIAKFSYNGSIAVGLVAGTTTYYTTTDFNTFTQRALPTAGGSLWYYNNLFIVVSGSNILYSSDGINWTTVTNNANASFVTLAYANGNYIYITALKDSAILNSQRIYVSTDLTNWTQYYAPAGHPTNNWVNSYQTVKYFNGYYFFYSGYAGGGGQAAYTTTDFTTYNTIPAFNNGGIGAIDVTYSELDKNYYAIGAGGFGAYQLVMYKGTGSSALTSSGSWSTVYNTYNGSYPQHVGFDSSSGSGYVVTSKGVHLIPTLSSVASETVSLTSFTAFADASTRTSLSYVGSYNGYVYMYDSASQVFGKIKLAAGSIRKPLLSALSSEVGNYYIREL